MDYALPVAQIVSAGRLTLTLVGQPLWTNHPPVLNTIGNQTATEGTQLSFSASAVDFDDAAASLVYSLGSGAPSGATITTGGVFSWTPTEEQGPGDYTIELQV